MPKPNGAKRRAKADTGEKRVEADLVRFEAERLPSGMYRHNPAKFIYEIARKQRDENA